MIMDLRTARIDNGWILFCMAVGSICCIMEKGIAGMVLYVAGSSIPLFLIILFAFGMLGAGDIKLFCALGGVLGTVGILKCILVSFVLGACISAAILMFNRNFCERIHYFIYYMGQTVRERKVMSYRRKEISAPENFHFTIPIFLSVVLYAGGVY